MNRIRTIFVLFLTVIAFASGASTAQAQSESALATTAKLKEALSSVCGDNPQLCLVTFDELYGSAGNNNVGQLSLPGCHPDPCAPGCPYAPFAMCIAADTIPPDMFPCLAGAKNCYLRVGDEVLPWPWATAGDAFATLRSTARSASALAALCAVVPNIGPRAGPDIPWPFFGVLAGGSEVPWPSSQVLLVDPATICPGPAFFR